MPLEKVGKKIEISELKLETKSQELSFDPEKFLNAEDKKKLKEKAFFQYWSVWEVGIPDKIKFLAPQFLEIVPPELADIGQKRLRESEETKSWGQYLKLLKAVLYIDPERAHELFEKNRSEILNTIKTKQFNDKVELLFSYIMFSRSDLEDVLTEDLWVKIKEGLERLRDRDWLHFAMSAGHARILYPDRFSEIKISPDEWRKMKDYARTQKKHDDWGFYITQAVYMSIISATEINFSDRGVDLVHSSAPKRTLTSPLPAKRKF